MIDLEAIKNRLNKLQGKTKTVSHLWKPEEGEYYVRVIPFPDNEGQPFKEINFYYNIARYGIVAPAQYGLRDPVQELINRLRADTDNKDGYELAKKLYPKMRAFAAIVVRGEKGEPSSEPKIWAFGKEIYETLLGFILNEDYGDITDLKTGNDLKVTVTRDPKKKWADITIVPRPKKTPAGSQAEVDKWLSAIPDLKEMYPLKSYDEIEKIVNDWLSSDDQKDEDNTGTEKTSSDSSHERDTRSSLSDDDDDDSSSVSKSKLKIDDALSALLDD